MTMWDDDEDDRPEPSTVRFVLTTLVVIVVILYVVVRVWSNVSAHAYPPPACQLFGGTWGPWSGWRCY